MIFWEDRWLGNLSLCQKYPRLYYLSPSQNILVSTIFTKGMACLKFRRFLREETLSMWNKFIEDCSQVRLTDKPDKVRWLLTKTGEFIFCIYIYQRGASISIIRFCGS
jgi:hypothetical protein